MKWSFMRWLALIGPVLMWLLVQGVTQPSPQCLWVRLEHLCDPESRSGHRKWMDMELKFFSKEKRKIAEVEAWRENTNLWENKFFSAVKPLCFGRLWSVALTKTSLMTTFRVPHHANLTCLKSQQYVSLLSKWTLKKWKESSIPQKCFKKARSRNMYLHIVFVPSQICGRNNTGSV